MLTHVATALPLRVEQRRTRGSRTGVFVGLCMNDYQNILAQTKGYRFDRKSKERVAKEAIKHAGSHAFRHRRAKKRDFRQLFTLGR